MLQDNNIENNLRELDNQQQPDLGQMDAHWQQMQAMLQPAALLVKKGFPKWMLNTLSVGIITILIGGAFLYLSVRKGNDNNTGIPKSIAVNEKAKVAATVPVKDSSEEKTDTSNLVADYNVSNKPVVYSKYFSDDDSVFANLKINYTPCGTCPAKDDSVLKPAYVNREALLKNLFEQVEKETQLFTVDNTRDTLIQFAEGTVVLIPANTLGGKSGIILTVKEFYKESDIILNQLSTVSNKDQLETGGMLQIKATLNGNNVVIDPSKPLKLYMPDTSSKMRTMQLFNGETIENHQSAAASSAVNWVPQSQYFSNKKMITQVRVLNLANMPFNLKVKKNGQIGYFDINDSLRVSPDKLKAILKEKYGYYKVRLRKDEWWWRTSWFTSYYYDSYCAQRIGDSVWMEKELADRYKLTGTATRTLPENGYDVTGNYKNYLDNVDAISKKSKQYRDLLQSVENKYSVDIKRFGWINCDRFYKDSREKILYAVNLGDSAKNYYTVLVFDRIKSMMNGYAVGDRVIFDNVPEGEKVKVISIGINKTGETVFVLQQATINTQELSGLQFETTSAPDLKASLSKMDR